MTLRLAALALAFTLIYGCGPSSFRKEITNTRVVQPAPQAAVKSAAVEGPFKWQLPQGWKVGPQRPMRIATFEISSSAEIDCYITSLGGAAGGLEANINRWRAQMSLGPAPAGELSALPRIPMLGKDAPLAEIAGELAASNGSKRAGSLLLGAVAELGSETVFVKMTGPQEAVRAEKANFEALCRSLEVVKP